MGAPLIRMHVQLRASEWAHNTTRLNTLDTNQCDTNVSTDAGIEMTKTRISKKVSTRIKHDIIWDGVWIS